MSAQPTGNARRISTLRLILYAAVFGLLIGSTIGLIQAIVFAGDLESAVVDLDQSVVRLKAAIEARGKALKEAREAANQ